MQNILAIDYGMRHVGIAVSQQETEPRPITTIDYQSDFELVDQIAGLIEEYEADVVLIGSGDETAAEKLIEMVKVKVPTDSMINFKLVDEYLTSQQAEWELTREEDPATDDHARAAELIIRDYLEEYG